MVDWPTYAYNAQRTGESPDTTISIGNVASLGESWHHDNLGNYDYNAQTQPIVATGVSVGGTPHSIVYVGGGSGNFYAFDAFSGTQLWRKNLGSGAYDCGSSSPFGVSGTPVLDKSNLTIYVPDGLHRVHALDLATGSEKGGWPVDLIEAGSDNGTSGDLHEFAHTALTLVNGKLYAGTGSTCDITPWQGRVAMIDAQSHTLQKTFYPVFGQGGKKYSGGGVWGWGGVSSDGGAVYAGVGNADIASQTGSFVQASDETVGYGEHVVALSADLSSVIGANLPIIVPNPPDAVDIDLSGTPVLFQPPGCPALLAVQGKGGFLLIYRRYSLAAGPIATYQFSLSSDVSHYIGNAAYSSQTGYLYASVATSIGGYRPGMAILQPTTGCGSFHVVANPVFGPDSFILAGAVPEDTALPRSTVTIANGVAFMGTPDGVLYARDAKTGAALWDSTALWDANTATDQIRFGPVVTGGWVYIVQVHSATLRALKVETSAASSLGRRRLQPLPAPQAIRQRPRYH
jgi:outer membrane protein assembly factor BamB